MEKLIPYILIPVWMILFWYFSSWLGSKVRPRKNPEQSFEKSRAKLHRENFYYPNLSARRFLAWGAALFAGLMIFLPFAQVYKESVHGGEHRELVLVAAMFLLLLFSGFSLARKRGDLDWTNEHKDDEANLENE